MIDEYIGINHLVKQGDNYITEKMLISPSSIEYIIEDSPVGYIGECIGIKLNGISDFIYATDSYNMMCLLMNSIMKEAQEDNDRK